MEKLSDYGAKVYSQHGEDGIIAKIFSLIGTKSKMCVEFGAWDGFHLSNTANLWAKQGWRGVLIEAEPGRFKDLAANTGRFGCHCIQARVGFTGENSLENILRREGLTGEPDLLSIDIDGDDYYVLQSLTAPGPRVVICEYNPTIPPHIELVQEPGGYFGCSALSLVKLAEQKGYKLVAVTEPNCIFVRAEDFPKFAQFETSFEKIAVTTQLTHLISGFDGDFALSREPTYGFGKPTTQAFAIGHLYRPTAPTKPPKKWKPGNFFRPVERWIRALRKRLFGPSVTL
jgi:hypothetical protein